jgi:Flp pilus assembly pilin Flp
MEKKPTIQFIINFLLIALVASIVIVGVLSMLGGKVSLVFSSIDTGLSTDESNGIAAYQPQAAMPTHAPSKPRNMGDVSQVYSGVDAGLSMDESSDVADKEVAISRQEEDDGRGDTPPRPQGRPAPLKAGTTDDNANFDTYLDYLNTYRDTPAQTVDVSEQYIITVINNQQQPLFDAQVRLYDGQQLLFTGKTYAGGKTIFHPAAYDVSPNTTTFRIVATDGQSTVETTIPRWQKNSIELVLPDATQPDDINLDLLFLLDTTGSMGDELRRIQETIDSIAQRIDAMEPRPRVRFAVVAYRDHGDDYVTLPYDFTSDLKPFRAVLNGLGADGGGDTPEALNEGLHEAINTVTWSEQGVRLIFIVADAGPHLDYNTPYDYLSDTQHAVANGIKIYPIAASNTDPYAEYVLRQMAQQTLGKFIFLTYQEGQESGVPGETTQLDAGNEAFTVAQLDNLIVQVVQQELAMARGMR